MFLQGAPAGNVGFEKQVVQDKVRKVQDIMNRLPLFKDIKIMHVTPKGDI